MSDDIIRKNNRKKVAKKRIMSQTFKVEKED
jgi:hypothetical protein